MLRNTLIFNLKNFNEIFKTQITQKSNKMKIYESYVYDYYT